MEDPFPPFSIPFRRARNETLFSNKAAILFLSSTLFCVLIFHLWIPEILHHPNTMHFPSSTSSLRQLFVKSKSNKHDIYSLDRKLTTNTLRSNDSDTVLPPFARAGTWMVKNDGNEFLWTPVEEEHIDDEPVSPINPSVESSTLQGDFEGSLLSVVTGELQKMRAEIVETWGEERESFFTSVQFGSGNMKNATRNYVKRKFMKAIAQQGTFTFTTMGTSVSAGHDCKFEQAYSAVMEQAFLSLFASVGVKVVVNNNAMGANPVTPMHYCLGTLGVPETDIYIYEFGMMTGRDPKEPFEKFLRAAFVHSNQPVVTFIKADRSTKNTVETDWSKWRDKYLGKGAGIMRHYHGFGINFWSIDTAVGIAGAKDDKKFQHATLISNKPFDKHAQWHPGPPGHKLVGWALAYSYAQVFVEAVAEFEALRESNPDITPEELDNPPAELPAPALSGCLSDPFCNRPKTTCYTSFEPKGRKDMDFSKVVVNEDFEDTRPTLPTPCGQPVGKKCLEATGLEKWVLGIWPLDEKAVMHSNDKKANYLDRKWSLLGREASGTLVLDLEVNQAGDQLMYCHPSGDFSKYPAGLEANAALYKVQINGVEVKATSTASNMCGVIRAEIPAGKLQLSITAPSSLLVAVSHVILP